jgi:hypothetical protein
MAEPTTKSNATTKAEPTTKSNAPTKAEPTTKSNATTRKKILLSMMKTSTVVVVVIVVVVVVAVGMLVSAQINRASSSCKECFVSEGSSFSCALDDKDGLDSYTIVSGDTFFVPIGQIPDTKMFNSEMCYWMSHKAQQDVLDVLAPNFTVRAKNDETSAGIEKLVHELCKEEAYCDVYAGEVKCRCEDVILDSGFGNLYAKGSGQISGE